MYGGLSSIPDREIVDKNDLDYLICVFIYESFKQSHHYNFQIQPDRPVIDVVQIMFDTTVQPDSFSGYPNDPKTYGITARFWF